MSRRTAVIVVAAALVAALVAVVVLSSGDDSGSTAAFCTAVRSGENPLDLFDRFDPGNADTAQLQRGVDRLVQLERAAPGEIKSDMKVLVDVARQLVRALDPASKDNPVPDFRSQFERVATASGNVTRFAGQQCAVSLDSGSRSPASSGG